MSCCLSKIPLVNIKRKDFLLSMYMGLCVYLLNLSTMSKMWYGQFLNRIQLVQVQFLFA